MKKFEYFDYSDETNVTVESETHSEIDDQLRNLLEDQSKEILELYNNEQILIEALEKILSDIDEYAPNTQKIAHEALMKVRETKHESSE